jgi:hypothetical protein
MVEFSLLLPLFIVVIFATIDFSGYFGARLSVENAARAGARLAVTVSSADYTANVAPDSGPGIVSQVVGNAADAGLPSTVNCTWAGTTLSPLVYPPFSFSGRGCIGIWYFEMPTGGGTGSPWLCGQWSVSAQTWSWWTSAGVTTGTPDKYCVVTPVSGAPYQDIVVVGVGYQYSPLTPLPALSGSALNTYGETQLLEED